MAHSLALMSKLVIPPPRQFHLHSLILANQDYQSTAHPLRPRASATTVIGTMDSALQTISQEQAKFGSLQNRLNYSISNLSRASVMTEAGSRTHNGCGLCGRVDCFIKGTNSQPGCNFNVSTSKSVEESVASTDPIKSIRVLI